MTDGVCGSDKLPAASDVVFMAAIRARCTYAGLLCFAAVAYCFLCAPCSCRLCTAQNNGKVSHSSTILPSSSHTAAMTNVFLCIANVHSKLSAPTIIRRIVLMCFFVFSKVWVFKMVNSKQVSVKQYYIAYCNLKSHIAKRR